MISYSGIVLDEKSRTKLLEIFKPTWEDEDGWETIAHHMTIKMGPLPEDRRNMIGSRFTMRVVAFAGNDKVKAVEVESPIDTINKTPHITLAVNRGNGGKPMMSNSLTNWVPVKTELYVTGIVEEVAASESKTLKESSSSAGAVPAVLSESIVHLENLKPAQLLAFLKTWNENSDQYHISEKVDGNYMALGVEGGRFYLRSKNRAWYSADQVPNVFFLHDFKRFFTLLENIPWNEIIGRLAKKYRFNFAGDFEIEGEAVPSFDHNIVVYDEKKIGDGVFIIFNTKTNIGKEQTGQKDRALSNPDLWKELAALLNQTSPIKFHSVPTVSLGNLSFDNQLVLDLSSLIDKHANIFANPARTPEDKALKASLMAAVLKIGKTAKQSILQKNIRSQFGPDVEGIVMAGPGGDLIKVVDIDKFTQTKKANWHFIDMLIGAEEEFKAAVKDDPRALVSALSKWERKIAVIERDFKKNGTKFLTIQKKFQDTDNNIKYAKALIQAMRNELKAGNPPDAVVEKYRARALVTEGYGKFRQSFRSNKEQETAPTLEEGGHVFKMPASAIPRELVKPNLKRAMELAGLGNVQYELIGNQNKPVTNDIDVAVDMKDVAEAYGIEDPGKFWDLVGPIIERKSNVQVSVNRAFQQFHLRVPFLDKNGQQLPTTLPSGEVIDDEPGFIQVDVFVGSKDWMRDTKSGSPADSKYKAKVRNIFLIDIFGSYRWSLPNDEPNTFWRYIFGDPSGLRLVQYRTDPTTGKSVKIREQVTTMDSKVVAEMLFGPGTTWADISSFEKLFSLFKSPKFKFPSKRDAILQTFVKSLKNAKTEVPTEVAEYLA